MPSLRLLSLVALVGLLPAAVSAQAPVRIAIRALLHDPLNPYAELYHRTPAGGLEKLKVSVEGIGESQEAAVENGQLRIFSSAQVDPAKPSAQLAATTAVPAGLKRAVLFILPAGENANPPYRLMLLDDAPGSFPWGESRVVNLTADTMAVEAGEHRLVCKAAAVTRVPKVTKVNDMNQAHTSFFQIRDGKPALFNERPTQYTDTVRNIFLLFMMPGVPDTQIRTIIDNEPAKLPE
jgi:hypothetical protein